MDIEVLYRAAKHEVDGACLLTRGVLSEYRVAIDSPRRLMIEGRARSEAGGTYHVTGLEVNDAEPHSVQLERVRVWARQAAASLLGLQGQPMAAGQES